MNATGDSTTSWHGGRLTIDLLALVRNWQMLAAKAAPAEASAAVKADAYGLGIEAVVPALSKAGCKTFFVAHFLEAARVRALAREAIIYVLNGLPPGAVAAYQRLALRPVLGSLLEINEWMEGAGDAPAALHVDTGMNRLGLSWADIKNLPADFHPALILSHFVASEDGADPVNQRQIAAFEALRKLNPNVKASLCNSSGLFLKVQNQIQYDLIRPGYALYGGNPTPLMPNPMRPVVRLDAQIIQIRDINAGESVGYNSQWLAHQPCRIATVSLGYADGYFRSGAGIGEKPGGQAILHGVRCPIVGRISMDLITLDVTNAPQTQRGDWANFIGPNLSIDEVAQRLNTNGYEVLTSLGRRHDRHYVTA